MRDIPATAASILTRARNIGLQAGLHYVYTGNVHDSTGATTLCSACQSEVIVRDWFDILQCRLSDDGRCMACGHALAGCFDSFNIAFGAHRLPIKI